MNIWENAVITRKGLALQSKLTQGTSLTITRVVAGSGAITPALLLQTQTEVAIPEQELKLSSVSYPEEGKCALSVYMTNEGLETGYTARQIGLYATDPDEGEILYFICQATGGGTVIPSESEMPGYSAEWTFYFQYGQADNVTVTVDPTNTINAERAQQMIEEGIDTHNDDPDAHADIREALKTAGYLLVTITDDVADKKMSEIKEAYMAGRPVMALAGNGLAYRLSSFDGRLNNTDVNGATFLSHYADTNMAGIKAIKLEGKLDEYGAAEDIPRVWLLPKSGGTMTGALTLSGDPTSEMHAATKQYVDNARANGHLLVTVTDGVPDKNMSEIVSAYDAGTPVWLIPISGIARNIYRLSEVYETKVATTDGTGFRIKFTAIFSSVSLSSPEEGGKFEIKSVILSGYGNEYGAFSSKTENPIFESGGTMNGDLTLYRDPVEDDHAATKRYVDSKYTYGTEDLVAGETPLETGKLHFVYE